MTAAIKPSLTKFFKDHPGLVVLTGAGCSLASGIPTYRDGEGNWQRTDPIYHREFLNEAARRRRYWSRSLPGWPLVANARPGPAHHALVTLQSAGLIGPLVTQNVDNLHQKAGHQEVIDLHGNLQSVTCMQCNRRTARETLQRELVRLNPGIAAITPSPLPDGDADLEDSQVDSFNVPNCPECGGILKPDVVFFGGTVPTARVELVMGAIRDAPALLAAGTSLKVFSGFRFCRAVHRMGKPLAILNPGWTRYCQRQVLR